MSFERKNPQGVPKKEGSSTVEYTNLPVGDNDGRLVYVADLGFHEVKYKGVSKGFYQHMSLGIEMVGHTVKIDGEEKPKFLWTRAFPVYEDMYENSGEFKMYSAFVPTAQEKDIPDWDAQLGKPCNVIIEHTDHDGKLYDNIKSLSGIPTKYQDGVPKATLTPSSGRTKEILDAMYGLTKWLYDRQVTDAEYTGAKDQPPAPAGAAIATGYSSVDDVAFDDDIPFNREVA